MLLDAQETHFGDLFIMTINKIHICFQFLIFCIIFHYNNYETKEEKEKKK